MRVLWPHPFPSHVLNAGSFMQISRRAIEAQGIEVEELYVGQVRSPIGLRQAAKAISVAARRHDLVHAQYGSACALATAWSECDRPWLVTVRGSDWHTFNDPRHLLFVHTRLARKMTIAACKRATAVIAVSARMGREIRTVVDPRCLYVIPSPIELGSWRAREHFQHAERPLEVLFSSNWEASPIKRASLARSAVEAAAIRHPEWQLRIRIATGVPHSAMPDVVSGCRLALCTSVYEGWPNCIKEALACNIPFVSTDVSDLKALSEIEPSCKVVPADPDLLAAAICDVILSKAPHDLRRHVGPMDGGTIGSSLAAAYREAVA